MRIRLALMCCLKALILALFLGLTIVRTAEADHIRTDVPRLFNDRLAPYGTWVRHPVYGRTWLPRGLPPDWRPYQDGYWEYTAQYGWLWISDWSWGWATDHYGRWVWDDWYGWLWVPGAVWAPAWVIWRYGNGYVSWAPMPIQYTWNPYAGYSSYYFDYDRYVPWDSWVITRQRDFPRRNQPRKWLPPQLSRDILQGTGYGDSLKVIDNRVFNRGIPVREIEKATGLAFKPVEPKIVSQPGDDRNRERPHRHGGEVTLYRPFGIQPTEDALRDEAGLDRAMADKLRVNERLSPRLLAPNAEARAPRRPGRLLGQPKPFDYEQAEAKDMEKAETDKQYPNGRLSGTSDQFPHRMASPEGDRMDHNETVGNPYGMPGERFAPGPSSEADAVRRGEWLRGELPREDALNRMQRKNAGRENPLKAEQDGRQRSEDERARTETLRRNQEAARMQEIQRLEQQRQAEEARMREESLDNRRELRAEPEPIERQPPLEEDNTRHRVFRRQEALNLQQEQAEARDRREARERARLDASRQQAERMLMQREDARAREEAAQQRQLEAERRHQREEALQRQEALRRQQEIEIQQQMQQEAILRREQERAIREQQNLMEQRQIEQQQIEQQRPSWPAQQQPVEPPVETERPEGRRFSGMRSGEHGRSGFGRARD